MINLTNIFPEVCGDYAIMKMLILDEELVIMAREFTVIIEEDEAGYLIATVPELKGCHTQAKSLDELMKRIKEAILLCLEVEGEEPSLKLVGIQKVAL